MFNKIKSYRNKRGFTLIELIVVIAVLAILVLLAAPRLVGRTNDAIKAQIQNDVRVVENKLSELLIDKPEALEDWAVADNSVIQELIESEELFYREGLVTELDTDVYLEIPELFLDEINTHLGGDFYSDERGTVYYHTEKSINGANKKVLQPGQTRSVGMYDYDGRLNNKGEIINTTYRTYDNADLTLHGLDYEAFDGDENTKVRGMRTVTADEPISGKNMIITASGYTVPGIGRSFNERSYFGFRDADGNMLPIEYIANSYGINSDKTIVTIENGFTYRTIQVTVPDGAEDLYFWGEGNKRNVSGDVVDIMFSRETENKTGHEFEPEVTATTFSVDWGDLSDVKVIRDGELYAELTDYKFKDNSLYTDTNYHYEFIFKDENNINHSVSYEVRTAKDYVQFSGVGPEAFDDDVESYAKRSGTVTWDKDITGKDLIITASGYTVPGIGKIFNEQSYFEFLDDEGNSLPMSHIDGHYGLSNDRKRATIENGYSIGTIKVTVPNEATSLNFYGEGGKQNVPLRIYEIKVGSEIKNSDKRVSSVSVDKYSASFSWNNDESVLVYRDGILQERLNSSSYVDTPLHSNEKYLYEFIFKDENKNRTSHKIEVYTEQNLVNFRGLTPGAFDSNLETSATRSGTVTWDKDISGKELSITAAGYQVSGIGTSYNRNLRIRFLDSEDNPIQIEHIENQIGLNSDRKSARIAYGLTVNTINVRVPDGAKKLQIYGESLDDKFVNAKIFNIAIND